MNGTTKAPSRDAKLMIATDKNPYPHAEKDACTMNSCGRPDGLMVNELDSGASGPGARFSKLPVITGPVKLFCFPFQLGVSKVLKIIQ